MTYAGIVYFAGPQSRWSGKIAESEIIARHPAPWKWLARKLMLSAHSGLDATRCGYALLCDGVAIEQYDPPPAISGQDDEVFSEGTVLGALSEGRGKK